jgi:retinal pigment epithelial membrane protein
VKVSHTLDRLRVAFDDPRLVAEVRLLLPATLAQRLGLKLLIDEHVDLGGVPDSANPGEKALTGEDEGWRLTVVHDPASHRSRLLILDARDPQRDPLAAAHLRHHVPQSFHGTFTTRVTQAGQRGASRGATRQKPANRSA